MSAPLPIEPDIKGWTWVLERPCAVDRHDGARGERWLSLVAIRTSAPSTQQGAS